MRKNPFHDIYKKMNSDILPSKIPNMIDVELTNKCNLSCKFCSRQFMEREQGFMSDSTFNRILQEIEEAKIPIRFIRWGEPFLHPKIIDYSREITKRGIPLHITTNGLLLNKRMCKDIVNSGIDSVIFSMQGLTEEDYLLERGISTPTLYKNIKLLAKCRGKKDKPYITITTTYTPSLNSDGVDIVMEQNFRDTLEPVVDKVEIGITNYSRIDNSKGNHIICKEPWQKLSIDWDGNVSACCGDYDRLLNVGDINKDSLYYLWNNEVLSAYRTLIKNKKHNSLVLCSKCYPAHGDVWGLG